jgi:cytochrome c oxidase accessory protein FixG
MWIEQRFEGSRQARIRLDAAPWTLAKIARRGGKQAVWLALGLWTGFTFVAYFTPAKTLAAELATFTLGPWETFWILFYGLATYGNAGYMREQVCKYMCPLRALPERDVRPRHADHQLRHLRGEPRGSRRRGVDPKSVGKGDCIDCTLCVQVCPTGIDIRKGLQYECIGCAACIDACDEVMDKMGSPKGLIRYATRTASRSAGPARDVERVARPRVLVYGSILVAVAAASSPASPAGAVQGRRRPRPRRARPLVEGGRSRTSTGCS